jgi:hypothetical protein
MKDALELSSKADSFGSLSETSMRAYCTFSRKPCRKRIPNIRRTRSFESGGDEKPYLLRYNTV